MKEEAQNAERAQAAALKAELAALDAGGGMPGKAPAKPKRQLTLPPKMRASRQQQGE